MTRHNVMMPLVITAYVNTHNMTLNFQHERWVRDGRWEALQAPAVSLQGRCCSVAAEAVWDKEAADAM